MSELVAAVAAAKRRLDAANLALRGRHGGDEWAAYDAAHDELLAAERALAASRDEEHAAPLDFPVRWNAGAPLPQLLVTDHHALLIFLVREVDPNWDGTYATMKDPASDVFDPYALVTFQRCISAKLGSPNDEVLHGHPLAGRGARPYTAQRVVNSHWVAELQRINAVHRGYRPEWWSDRHHYIFWFHDSTFECIAEGFEVEVRRCTMAQMLLEACRRLTGKTLLAVP